MSAHSLTKSILTYLCYRHMDWLYCAVILLVVVFLFMVGVILSSDCDLTLLWYMKFGKSPGKHRVFHCMINSTRERVKPYIRRICRLDEMSIR